MKILILAALVCWIFGDTIKDSIKGFTEEHGITKAMVRKLIIAGIVILIVFF